MADDNMTYWLMKDPEEVVTEVKARREKYLDYFAATSLWEKVSRSYRFYHGNFQGDYLEGGAIKITGPEGDLRLLNSNEYRSVIQTVASYIVAQRPEWDTQAESPDHEALEACKLGNQILDALMDDPCRAVEQKLANAMEDALVTTAGYLWVLADPMGGQELAADMQRQDAQGNPASVMVYGGDVKFLNVSFSDVSWDPAFDFDEAPWVHVRRKVNRWDLMAQVPERAEEIRNARSKSTKYDDLLLYLDLTAPNRNLVCEDDLVVEEHLYVRPSPAMPAGRHIVFVDQTWLKDSDLPNGENGVIPVARIIPGRYLATSFGYTPAFDVQGPQEGLNAALSTICTNQNALGQNKVWFKEGEPINRAELEPGVTVLQTATKPEVLNLLASAPELFKSVELYTMLVERLLGVSGTSRGAPPPGVDAASALAALDSRTMQNASTLISQYRQFLCRVGLITLKVFATLTAPKGIMVTGANNGRFWINFTSEMLKPVAKVAVKSGNPLTSTIEGRKNLAVFLAQLGLVKTAEEVITVLKTGDIERLTEHTESQLRAAQAENDALLRGEAVPTALIIDNHRFHILKHVAIFDTPESRKDPNKTQTGMAHILQHVQMMMDPNVQMIQTVLGYAMPPMPGQMGPGALPPQEQAGPGTPNVEAPKAGEGGGGQKGMNLPQQAEARAPAAAETVDSAKQSASLSQ